jgi:hypothetical protein
MLGKRQQYVVGVAVAVISHEGSELLEATNGLRAA